MVTKAFAADKARIDKWLWAARFFKTRHMAKKAIDGGKVHCAGQRVKPSKEIAVGDVLDIRQGFDVKEVRVTALDDRRRGAAEAALLYEETAASSARREKLAAERKAGLGGFLPSDHKPSKKERREIHRFRNINASGEDH